MSEQKTVGILGGMGPAATIDLFQKIVSLTDARGDAEHIHILIDNEPRVPDRTAALLRGGESPLPTLCQMAKRLEAMGADLLAVSCNTSHFFYQDIADAVSVPVVNMIDETAKAVFSLGVSDVIVLATDGTVNMKLYDRYMEKYGITVHGMSTVGQSLVMKMIYDYVKGAASDFPKEQFVSELIACGADKYPIVLGCTELPIAFERLGINGFRLIDPATVLARSLILAAGYSLRKEARDGT